MNFIPLYRTFRKQDRRSISNSGLTLIECLVAIIVIGVTTASITPALVIAAATRVQSQKTEQAIQVAQGEIDGLRLLLERGTYTNAQLPPVGEDLEDDAVFKDLASVPPPSNDTPSSNCEPSPDPDSLSYPATSAEVCLVSVVDNSVPEYVVQIFRTKGRESSDVATVFDVGVRVYDFRAYENNLANLTADALTSAGMTGGFGSRGTRPLAVIYANVGKGDGVNSFCDYHAFLGDDDSLPPECILPGEDEEEEEPEANGE